MKECLRCLVIFYLLQNVEVFIAQNRLKLLWHGSVYVGNKSGLEFTTKGPDMYKVNEGRGR